MNLGSDLCKCGDYRSQHKDWQTTGGLKCEVHSCRVPYGDPHAPRCQKFEFSRRATPEDEKHWNEYHRERWIRTA